MNYLGAFKLIIQEDKPKPIAMEKLQTSDRKKEPPQRGDKEPKE